jgi:hypothetical protein
VPGNEIGVEMGLKNMGYVYPHGTGLADVHINIPLGVDYSTAFTAGKNIRTMGDFSGKKMFEQHYSASFLSFELQIEKTGFQRNNTIKEVVNRTLILFLV